MEQPVENVNTVSDYFLEEYLKIVIIFKVFAMIEEIHFTCRRRYSYNNSQ